MIPFVMLYKVVLTLMYVDEGKHAERHFPLPLVIKLLLRRIPRNIREIMAKIKLPKKPHSMVIF